MRTPDESDVGTLTEETDTNTSTQTEMQFEELTGDLKTEQVTELICQALETEIGGVQIYQTAIRCAKNEELKEEWTKYLEETQNHERILREVCEKTQIDPDTDSTGRRVVKHNGEALVQAMETALNDGDPAVAQIVAAECVVLAETKDHFNWQLIGEVSGRCEGELREALEEAYEEVEDQEDEHLYHTKGWARELWFEALGMPAQFPPVEEEKKVTTRIGAARAENARSRELSRKNTRTSQRRGAKKTNTGARKTTGRKTTGRKTGGRATGGRGGKTSPATKAGARRNKARGQARGRNK